MQSSYEFALSIGDVKSAALIGFFAGQMSEKAALAGYRTQCEWKPDVVPFYSKDIFRDKGGPKPKLTKTAEELLERFRLLTDEDCLSGWELVGVISKRYCITRAFAVWK